MSKPLPPPPPNNDEFLRWLETVDDPAERFELASKVLVQQTEASARLAAIRAAAAAATYEGRSYGQVAARLGISRSRAQQLVNEGRATTARTVKPKRAGKAKKSGAATAASSTELPATDEAGSAEAARTRRERSDRKRDKEN
jgi:hypothetical protein